MLAAGWTSLEIVKLIVAALTPIAVVGLGWWINRATRRIEKAQRASERVTERRLEIYRELAPLLNQLYCFFRLVGDFRSTTPPQAIEAKRDADEIFHVNRFLFDGDFATKYFDFMNVCFAHYRGVGKEAELRADLAWHRAERGTWDRAWDGCYVTSPDEMSPPRDVEAAYLTLMEAFAASTGAVA